MNADDTEWDQAWFLRCEIREKLVEFIRKNYPESLPRLRAEFEPVQEMRIESREGMRRGGRSR